MLIILRDSEGVDIHAQEVQGQPSIIEAHGVYYQRTGLHDGRAYFCEGTLLRLDDSTKLTPSETGLAKPSTVAATGTQQTKETSCS